MDSSASYQGVKGEERTYLRSRAALCVGLLLLLMIDIPLRGSGQMIYMYLFLLSVLAAGTLFAYVSARRGARSVTRAMSWMLVPDLSVVAGFTFLFHDLEDAFYPVAVFLAIAYALVARRRDMWVVGAAVAAAYTVGHLVTREMGVDRYLVLALKALAIPFIGAMVASSVSQQREREEDAAKAVADEAGAKEQLESRLAELQAVVRITETIHSSLDLDEVGFDVLEILGGALGIDRCSLFVIDKRTTDVVFSASRGDVARSVENPLQQTSGSSEHFSSRAVCDRGEAIVLFCADQVDMDNLSTMDELLLNAVASQLVVAVENSHLYGLTKVLSITDELTGLYNYRELQSRLNQEVERAARYESSLSLLMIDADDFKSYNDTYGHVAGDKALAELAGVMRSAVREVDFVARYGGEEFTVLLPETDSAGAFVVAEKIREAVADHDFPEAEVEGKARGPLTVSVGIATFPTYADDTESLLSQADNALYRAKNEGRNRVRTPQLVAQDDTHDAEDTIGD